MIVFPALDDKHKQGTFNQLIREFFSDELVDADQDELESFYLSRCPPWPLFQHRERCVRAVHELHLFASDGYPHVLSQLHQYILFRSMTEWSQQTELTEPQPEDFDAMEDLFEDTDFEMIELIATDLLEGGLVADALRVRVEELLELMPDDIRVRVEAVLADRQSAGGSGGNGSK